MPANKKHLTKSPWIRFAKILIGVIGGYLVMFTFHLLLTRIFPSPEVIATSFITGYLLWAVLLLLTFLSRSVWKVLGIYTLLILVFSGACYMI
ncbi:hypothetical protein [Pedobacter frigidisoli]|uniref:hypothetical protein n=1 Tax=Pedobacter frigidisoli TaxID=2530455 RepID=UPI00292CB3A1|nr:hypothetical protein [Pedobacter frigidisoli]